MLFSTATGSALAYKYLTSVPSQPFSTAPTAAAGETLHEIDFAAELGEGEMKEIKVGPKDSDKVLIARNKGKLHAVGAYCTHFGAPLSWGVLFNDKVLCPFHGAGFNIETGAIDGAPALDSLAKFDIVEKDGKSYVKIPEVLPKSKPMPLAKRDPKNKKHFVVVGGGPAGLNCVETLRQSGFTGQVTLISDEDILPYDRTLLTKALPVGSASGFVLRSSEYLDNADVEYKLGKRVTKVDA